MFHSQKLYLQLLCEHYWAVGEAEVRSEVGVEIMALVVEMVWAGPYLDHLKQSENEKNHFLIYIYILV